MVTASQSHRRIAWHGMLKRAAPSNPGSNHGFNLYFRSRTWSRSKSTGFQISLEYGEYQIHYSPCNDRFSGEQTAQQTIEKMSYKTTSLTLAFLVNAAITPQLSLFSVRRQNVSNQEIAPARSIIWSRTCYQRWSGFKTSLLQMRSSHLEGAPDSLHRI
jgi:hypothetical protein